MQKQHNIHAPAPMAQSPERGSTLIIVLVMMLSIGALITAHLTKAMAEVSKTVAKVEAQKALAIAEGELERAKNIVNAAPYVADQNTALLAAMGATPKFVPGTSVEVVQVGGVGSDWFMLRAEGRFRSAEKKAQSMVKQRSPLSAFNFFVVDHPLGISGAPRGAIHSNQSIDFYFPYGLYRDQLTAGTGFNFKAGATPQNTRLQGDWNPSITKADIMAGITTADLMANANTLKVTDDLIAEVEFQGKTTEVKLYKPSFEIPVEKTGIQSVFSHYDVVPYDWLEPVMKTEEYTDEVDVMELEEWETNETEDMYKYVEEPRDGIRDVYEDKVVNYTEAVPVYDTRMIEVEVDELVWVEDPPPTLEELEGGFAVGGKEPELGHWETITRNEMQEETYIKDYVDEPRTKIVSEKTGTEPYVYYETVQYFDYTRNYEQKWSKWVKVGTEIVDKTREVLDYMKTVTLYYNDPVYVDEPYTYIEMVTIPEELVQTVNTPTDGVIYIDREVRSVKGTINGQVSLVSGGKVKITGSLNYVDDAGEKRMLNGTDPDQKYSFNPNYTGYSVLGIVANEDIQYAQSGPANLEINASMISINGKVGFEGIMVSADGATVSVDPDALGNIKDSIRRLGGIVARHRPVTTYVDSNNNVLAGYKKGISYMDRNMILKVGGTGAPPFKLEMNQPTWTLKSAGKLIQPK